MFPARPLSTLTLVAAFAVLAAGCTRSGAEAVYDEQTRLLHRVSYDADRDGRIEARLYFAAGRPARLEADADGDGRVDRWEHYGADGALERLGTSTAHDGRADMWIVRSGTSMRTDISTLRDGVRDRREFYVDGVLQRLELDTNHDGRIDQWQRYEGTRLRELALDTTFAGDRPDRRLVYAEDGTTELVTGDDQERDDASR